MKIAVFGGTGGTGQQIIAQALEAGHSIQALVRAPEKLKHTHTNLTVIQGNVLDPGAVAQVILGTEAVIISLGTTGDNPGDVVSRGTEQIISMMQTQGIARVIAVTSLGVGDSKDQVGMPFKLVMQTVLRKIMQDKERQETLLRESKLVWTIVRPGGLTDGPQTGQYTAGVEKTIIAGQVSRADVAAFVLQQLTDTTYHYQAPAIT